jgi:hypothetical protein
VASRQTGRPGGSGPSTKLTKAERKEEARRQRLEIERRMARTRRTWSLAAAALVVVAAITIALFLLLRPETESKAEGLPGLLASAAPWEANTTDLTGRLNRLGLGQEGVALHIHPHLSIFVSGQEIPIPANIGLTSSFGAPLHTHDATGIVHVESADPNRVFTLGEFFDVWGVRFTPTCLGSYCDDGDRRIRMFVDDSAYRSDPRALTLADHEQIVLTYGTRAQVPDPLPGFDFSGLQA